MLDSVITKKGYIYKMDYDYIKNEYNKLEDRYTDLFEVNKIIREDNEKLKIQVGELSKKYEDILKWKKDHKCDDNNLNVDELINTKINQYKIEIKKEYENIFEEKNGIINDLNIKLSSNIEDNIIFKELKDNYENIKKQMLDIQKQDIKVNNEHLENKINVALKNPKEILSEEFGNEKNNMELNFNNKFKGLEEIIKNLQYKLDNKKTNIPNIKNDKEYLYNSIVIYDPKILSHKFYGTKTYFTLKYYKKLDNLINKDKCNYEDFDKWVDLSEEDFLKVKNKKSRYLTKKIKRCVEIFDKYKDKLLYVKFNLSFLTKINNIQYIQWLELLEEKLNNINVDNKDIIYMNNIMKSIYSLDNNKDIEESKEEICIDCKDCNKYEPKLCQKHLEYLQNNDSTDNEEEDY